MAHLSVRLPFTCREVCGGPKSFKIFRRVFTCILNLYPQYEGLELILHKENANLLEFSQGEGEGMGSVRLGLKIVDQIWKSLGRFFNSGREYPGQKIA